MRMNQDERRFDFHGLGAALKRAREEKGWTQAYVAELVDRDSRTIMNIENKGHYPSFDLFVKLITMFDVSVDQFIHADGGARSSSCRKHIDVLLNSMNEKELVVIEATAEGIKKARETEVPEFFCAILGAVAKWQAITNPIILFLLTNRIKTIMRHILVFPKIEIY
ncbi:HTH-type transcriptional regulator immR [Roseburia inulinivorans]|jgi:transcriptional regulator with XRE-family HTH domain|nr:HTH-type transcriptional regulator immR [Roseburia inulinivorans]CUO54241.1 HTH-type transcriptional regulator immR [Roseburia inulinivorans]